MQWFVRWRIVRSLSRAGEKHTVGKYGRESAPFLLEILQNPNAEQELRRRAINGVALLAERCDAGAFDKALRDQDAEIRIVAIRTLEKLRGHEAVGQIACMLPDKDRSVANAAMAALARIRTPDAMRALVTSLPEVGPNGEDALLQIGDPAIPLLLEALMDEKSALARRAMCAHLLEGLKWTPTSDNERQAYRMASASYIVQTSDCPAIYDAIRELSHFMNVSGVKDQVLASLNHKSRRVQLSAALALGKDGHKDAIDPLIRLFSNSDVEGIRLAAVLALGRIFGTSHDPRFPDILVRALTDMDRDVREAAVDLLQRACPPEHRECIVDKIVERVLRMATNRMMDIGNTVLLLDKINKDWGKSEPAKKLASALVEALQRDGDRHRRIGIMWALERIGSPAVDAILSHPDYPNNECLAVLAKNGHARALSVFLNRLQTRRGVLEAAHQAGRFRDRRAVESLVSILTDEKWLDANDQLYFDRNEIGRALGRIGDKRAIEPLRAALRMYNKGEVVGIAKGLAWLGDEEGWLYLEKACSQSETIWHIVDDDLSEIGGPRAVTLLKSALRSDVWKKRLAAAERLLKILEQEAVDLVAPLLDDKVEDVRKYLAQSLANVGGPRATNALKQGLIHGTVNVSWLIPHFVSQGDYSAADMIIQAVFAFPRSRLSLKGLIDDTFFRDYHSLVLEAASYWVFELRTPYSKNKFRPGPVIYDTDECLHAVSQLEEIGTPIAANLLHEISKMKNVKVVFSYGCLDENSGDLDFTSVRASAHAALQRLRNPSYRPELYLNADNWNR